MGTTTLIERLGELEQQLGALGVDTYREAVDEALQVLRSTAGNDTRLAPSAAPAEAEPLLVLPLTSGQQKRMLTLGRKANRGSLTSAERQEYIALIRLAEERSRQAALDALSAAPAAP